MNERRQTNYKSKQYIDVEHVSADVLIKNQKNILRKFFINSLVKSGHIIRYVSLLFGVQLEYKVELGSTLRNFQVTAVYLPKGQRPIPTEHDARRSRVTAFYCFFNHG